MPTIRTDGTEIAGPVTPHGVASPGLLEEVVRAAEKLRAHLGAHWPLILSVPTGVSVDLGVALNLCGITVEVDRYIAPGAWYLRDGVKR